MTDDTTFHPAPWARRLLDAETREPLFLELTIPMPGRPLRSEALSEATKALAEQGVWLEERGAEVTDDGRIARLGVSGQRLAELRETVAASELMVNREALVDALRFYDMTRRAWLGAGDELNEVHAELARAQTEGLAMQAKLADIRVAVAKDVNAIADRQQAELRERIAYLVERVAYLETELGLRVELGAAAAAVHGQGEICKQQTEAIRQAVELFDTWLLQRILGARKEDE